MEHASAHSPKKTEPVSFLPAKHSDEATLDIFRQVQAASRSLAQLSNGEITTILLQIADAIVEHAGMLCAENARDLALLSPTDPKYDRLTITKERVETIANEMRTVAGLPSPLGEILEERTLANRLHLQKISVPMGVIGIIYEARPNVTFDAFALCLKAGSAVVLKGGSDAEYSNKAAMRLIHDVLAQHGLSPFAAHLLPPERASALALLNAAGFVDVIIPRGSQSLIEFVRTNARVPVIETGAGIVHTYFDAEGNTELGANVIVNAKTRRVSVCNALDTLIIHHSRIQELPLLVGRLAERHVHVFADREAFEALHGIYPAGLLSPAEYEHFGTEFLDYKMSIKTVPSLQAALEHIAVHSSKHSEAIITQNEETAEHFVRAVDAAVVYVNASTAFTDGGQFGMGAEIGISTQKLHARGPMALREITSYKWVVRGNGQIR